MQERLEYMVRKIGEWTPERVKRRLGNEDFPPSLCIGVIFSVVVIVLTQFTFAGTPERFRGGHNLGEVMAGLSMSYLAGFIFYWQVVVLPEKRKRKRILNHVSDRLCNLIGVALCVVEAIQGIPTDGKSDNARRLGMTESEIEKACGNRTILESPPRFLGTWSQYLASEAGRAEWFLSYINRLAAHLPDDLSMLISKYEQSTFFWTSKRIAAIGGGGRLDIHAGPLAELLMVCTEINDYLRVNGLRTVD